VSAGKRARRSVDGVLLLDKPRGITSQRAVSSVKRLTNAAKVGHTGTLDPLATGLLPLTFGEATKFSQTLLDADKRYLAIVQLGITTTTADAEGEVLEKRPVDASASDIGAILSRFVGESEQTPPMYSALKVQGKPLYAYARGGVEIDRKPRRIRIASLDLIEQQGDQITIDVRCSKGTYIRVLAEDIGAALGCGASLAGLRRTEVGPFGLDAAIALDAFEAMSEADRLARIAPADTLLQALPRVDLDLAEADRLIQGQRVALDAPAQGLVRVYGGGASFIGVAEVSAQSELVARRLVAANPRKP
jgi:tRNA pseudouridine55 synthase